MVLKQIIRCLFIALVCGSCSTAHHLKKAEQIYEEGGYYKALNAYSKVFRKVPTRELDETVAFHYAESLRRLGRTKTAEIIYNSIIASRRPRTATRPATPALAPLKNPEVYLRYGQVLLENEKYDLAKEQFLAYKTIAPDDEQADAGLIAYEIATNPPKDTVGYKVESMAALNTAYNEYAPAFGTDDYETLFFTSTRKSGNTVSKKYDATGEFTADLFRIQMNREGKWGRPSPITGLNTKGEDGAGIFNSSYTQFYFTRCPKVKRERLGCKIYRATFSGGEWGDVEPTNIVPDSVTAAHPAISHDGLTLYFTSDLPGGMGGMDIWQVSRANEEDNWGEPMNLGPQINTKGNETYPFMHAKGVLYFASNGHPGLGGLDLFRAIPDRETGEGWIIENMGLPFNSSSDDFGFIMERDNRQGYFSSRRKNGKGGDDIYAFRLDTKPIEFYFEALVKDAKTGKAIVEADIRLIGNNGAVLYKKSENNGMVRFRIHPGIDYLAIASHRDYLNGKVRFDTHGWTESKTRLDTLALVATDKPIEIPNIFFDFNAATLRDDSSPALELLLNVMQDNPHISIALRAHTDNRGNDEINIPLSQKRAQAVVDYLIKNGIDETRMEGVGLGASEPKTVDEQIAEKYPFLRTGTKLDAKFIDRLMDESQREICHQLNRRTEMQVIRTNYTQRIR